MIINQNKEILDVDKERYRLNRKKRELMPALTNYKNLCESLRIKFRLDDENFMEDYPEVGKNKIKAMMFNNICRKILVANFMQDRIPKKRKPKLVAPRPK